MRLGLCDLPGIGELPGWRLGQPVAVGQAPRMGPGCARLPPELGGEFLLPLLDNGGAAMLLVAEAEPLFGRLEQGAQECALPLAPHAGANRSNIDHGEDQQQPQPFRALHLMDEILDRFGVEHKGRAARQSAFE